MTAGLTTLGAPGSLAGFSRVRGAIRILPPELIARIAAGEVVERPASVLKELVENALDAGARRIAVTLEAGGISEVSVHDDGCGLAPEELTLAVQPHATSKLPDAAALQTLQTLGFRGEALPSIASVAHFSMVSRQRPAAPREAQSAFNSDSDAENGYAPEAALPLGADAGAWRIDCSGGHPQNPEPRPAAGAPGTTVVVRELFYNLPARQKFLKGHAAEAAACADTLQRLALTRPDVAFKLQQGRSTLLELAAVRTSPADLSGSNLSAHDAHAAPALPARAYFQRARELLGRANSRELLEIELHEAAHAGHPELNQRSSGRLYGLLSPPAVSRPNRNLIYLTVNGRSVKDRTLTSALLEACRHLLPPRRFPIAVLFLELDGADVDINVHPAKSEVRFRQPGRIYALLHQAVRQAFALRDPLMQHLSRADHEPLPPLAPRVPLSYAPLGALLANAESDTPAGDNLAEPAFTELSTHATFEPEVLSRTPEADSPFRVHEAAAPFGAAALARHTSRPDKLSTRHWTPRTPAPDVTPQAADFRILGQAAGSYIVLEDETGLRVIDQHALHERILFESLLHAALTGSRADSQGLLVPETVELSPAQAALLSAEPEYQAAFSANRESGSEAQPLELLRELGFDCAPFGPRTLLVRAVPAILRRAAPGRVVSEFLDCLAAGDDTPPASWAASGSAAPGNGRAQRRFSLREKAAYIVSCKAALKAGERLTLEQMHALILEFRRAAGPLAERGNLTCPHGRKLSLDVSWHDLERAVGRA